jgi:hypothetical protein
MLITRFNSSRPIVTYNDRGVSKPGTVKEYHCIAYSSLTEPLPKIGEMPRNEETPMMPSIRIKVDRGQELDCMSRIDFSRTYTVEHNVKVCRVGYVHKKHVDRLIQQWTRVTMPNEFRDRRLAKALGVEGWHDTSDVDRRNYGISMLRSVRRGL